MPESNLSDVQHALSALGTKRLILAIHDQSFPSNADEEIGRGSPYTAGGLQFLRFCADLGFNTIQFGPQGKTTVFNPSPYDGTIFSRNDTSISLKDLTSPEWNCLIDGFELERVVSLCPASASGSEGAAHYQYAYTAQQSLLRKAFQRFKSSGETYSLLSSRMNRWREEQGSVADDWLERDAMFEALSIEYGSDDWRGWSQLDQRLYVSTSDSSGARQRRLDELRQAHSGDIEFYQFCQFVSHEQHVKLRQFTQDLKLKIYGDMQIGYSPRDAWSRASLFLTQYLMGAPPSRTNPEGQPWGYPVLDPCQYVMEEGRDNASRRKGKAVDFVSARAQKMLAEFDGLRIDHPHGFVCPWVYQADDPDPLQAVKNGARLFSSPNFPDHGDLAEWAIALPDQLTKDSKVPRYADNWVTDLTDAQVERYSILVDCIVAAFDKYSEPAGASSAQAGDVVCEVLSTCPYPLKRVLERHHLGRFCVTQKADLTNPADLYRSENAKLEDLIMVANHDTKPIWLLVDEWFQSGQHDKRAAYLAERLEPRPEERSRFAAVLTASKEKFAQAMFADLFASPAGSVSIFFADLLGSKEIYNRPGTISSTNWSSRVPRDYQRSYKGDASTGKALNLPRALSMALRARYPEPDPDMAALISRLEA
jgi:4-alpha-glucanotransferase